MRLDGHRAVVTSVGSPIGGACADLFAREGAEVVAVDRDTDIAAAVADRIVTRGGVARAFVADPASEHDAVALAAACGRDGIAVDVLVNASAAMDDWVPGQDTMADWERIYRLNVLGPTFVTRALLALLQRSRAGSVVFLSALDGIRGNPDYPAWSAAKGAMIPLTHVLAHQYGRHGIRVNCIASALISQMGPGDPQPAGLAELAIDGILAATPLGRRPEATESRRSHCSSRRASRRT